MLGGDAQMQKNAGKSPIAEGTLNRGLENVN